MTSNQVFANQEQTSRYNLQYLGRHVVGMGSCVNIPTWGVNVYQTDIGLVYQLDAIPIQNAIASAEMVSINPLPTKTLPNTDRFFPCTASNSGIRSLHMGWINPATGLITIFGGAGDNTTFVNGAACGLDSQNISVRDVFP